MKRRFIFLICVFLCLFFVIACISDANAMAKRIKPWCGDGLCNGKETCKTCPKDCGVCPPPAPYCGDGKCNGTETCSTCPNDCGVCPPVCGDGTCNGVETCSTCPNDCGVCPPVCGDGSCNGTETCKSCPNDCGVCPPECGDGECNGTETCLTCATDCGACPPAPSLNVVLEWDANAPEDNVTNYKIYYGYQSGVYDGSYDAGTNLSLSLTLEQQKVYYFSATAMNSVEESGYSNEVTYSTMYDYWSQ